MQIPFGGPLAPHIRMLLASDGSTTILLQAMLGQPLDLRLDEVNEVRGSEVDAPVRQALRLTADAPAILRRSALVTAEGETVSRNRVVGPSRGDAVSRLLTAGQPIGWTMNGARAGHHRRLLDSGWSRWETADRQLPCATKTYVIYEGDDPVMHITERFNPRLIPGNGTLDRAMPR